ncbi:hypothetical protein Tco_0989122 [Tanacetum coccineum]|uniref:Uncharacterized protein n=1 Tax=Tanacetum coccineum TaxID=301880 RepID=A0ABQ5ETB1_9ASTR
MDATVVDDITHRRSVMTNPWDDLNKKKPTMHTEDIEETTMVEVLEIGVTVNHETITKIHNLFFNLKTKVEQGQKNHQAAIQDLETKFGQLSDQCSTRPTGSLPSITQTNPKPNSTNDKSYRPSPTQNKHVNVVFTRSGKTYDPPVNLNAKTTTIHDDNEDEVDEAEKEVDPSSSKQAKSNPPPLKAYKP